MLILCYIFASCLLNKQQLHIQLEPNFHPSQVTTLKVDIICRFFVLILYFHIYKQYHKQYILSFFSELLVVYYVSFATLFLKFIHVDTFFNNCCISHTNKPQITPLTYCTAVRQFPLFSYYKQCWCVSLCPYQSSQKSCGSRLSGS